jgi:hypothetical protein
MAGIQDRVYDGVSAVTPSDTVNDPAGPFAGLYVTVAGNLKLTDATGVTTGPVAVPIGELPVRVVRVWATGTTATVLGLRAGG